MFPTKSLRSTRDFLRNLAHPSRWCLLEHKGQLIRLEFLLVPFFSERPVAKLVPLPLARLAVPVNYILWSADAFLWVDWVCCQISLFGHKLAEVVEVVCFSPVTPNLAESFRPFTAKVSCQLFPQLAQNIGCVQVTCELHACHGVSYILKSKRKFLQPCSVVRFHGGPAR